MHKRGSHTAPEVAHRRVEDLTLLRVGGKVVEEFRPHASREGRLARSKAVERLGIQTLRPSILSHDRIEPGTALRRHSPSGVRANSPGRASVKTPTLLRSRSIR